MAKGKECHKCEGYFSLEHFPYNATNPFFLDDYSDFCFECLYKKLDPTDFNSVDRILRYLDFPFYPDIWVEAYTNDEEKALEIYCEKMRGKEYGGIDWTAINNIWREKMKNGTIQEDLSLMNQDWIDKMHAKWGTNYTFDQLNKLEEILNDTLKKQNIVTDIQNSQAKIICMQLLGLEEKAREGINVSKELKDLTDTINKSGFEAKNTRNYSDFESIGELINHCVRKGYKPKFYQEEEKDLVDATIKNQQVYLKRLVLGEPGLADMVEARKESLAIAAKLEELGYDAEEEIDDYGAQAETISYEDEGEFNNELVEQ